MQAKASESTGQNQTVTPRQHRGERYRKVFDGRKRRVRGLWQRGEAYYAQLTVLDATGKKIVRRTRLEDKDGTPVATVAEAVKAMEKLRVKREDQELVLESKRSPMFKEYAETYRDYYRAVTTAKSPATVTTESSCINRLVAFFGDTRLREISPAQVKGYVVKRSGQDVSPRAINLELVVLRNVMKHAAEDGKVPTRFIPEINWLKYEAPKRRLVTQAEIDKICETAIATAPRTGRMLSDFVRLMACSGARLSEALALKWSDVSFDLKQLTIFGKGSKTRHVDFNGPLEAHLQDMHGRRAPDTAYVFPSNRSEGEDKHAVTLNMALRKVREKAEMPWFTAHLCRHYFASFCVMSGIDYGTLKEWLGHEDTKLIDEVYGHLNREHKQAMAQKLSFGPAVVAEVEGGVK